MACSIIPTRKASSLKKSRSSASRRETWGITSGTAGIGVTRGVINGAIGGTVGTTGGVVTAGTAPVTGGATGGTVGVTGGAVGGLPVPVKGTTSLPFGTPPGNREIPNRIWLTICWEVAVLPAICAW